MKIKAYSIHAFAKTIEGGNPAGVVMDADQLLEEEMKKIAEILGYSETAFVMKSNVADFKVRFFTPNAEVDLCGHATIGTFATLLEKGLIHSGIYTQETKAGILNVEVKQDTTIMMNQTLPEFSDILDVKEIAKSLQISEDYIGRELPIQIVSTGLRDIIVPITSLGILKGIKPDFNRIAEISKKYKAVGYHIFSLDTQFTSHAHCRNFAPLYDIPEESATGTSSGALACYLYHYGKVSADRCNHMIFEQGYSMNLPSEILVSLRVVPTKRQDSKEIVAIKVGGKALRLDEKEIFIM